MPSQNAVALSHSSGSDAPSNRLISAAICRSWPSSMGVSTGLISARSRSIQAGSGACPAAAASASARQPSATRYSVRLSPPYPSTSSSPVRTSRRPVHEGEQLLEEGVGGGEVTAGQLQAGPFAQRPHPRVARRLHRVDADGFSLGPVARLHQQ